MCLCSEFAKVFGHQSFPLYSISILFRYRPTLAATSCSGSQLASYYTLLFKLLLIHIIGTYIILFIRLGLIVFC